MRKYLAFSLLLSLTFLSCGSQGFKHYGAEEFVLDSYKIQEGKFAILEVEGVEASFEESCLQEEDGKEGKVYFTGVDKHSSVDVGEKTRLLEVLSKAELPPGANLFMSYILREGKILAIDLERLLIRGDLMQNIFMKDGDHVVIVREASKVSVMGEVKDPKTLSIPNGMIPLRQALAEAGGILFTGDKSYIQVIRSGASLPKVYVLNWDHLLELPNRSLLLMPGDVVYVAPKPITEWHRFISQLIPSIAGAS